MRPNQAQEERLRKYPDPEIEKQRLDVFQQMIRVLDKQNLGLDQTQPEPQETKSKNRKSKRGSYKHLKQKAGGKTNETQEANS